MDEVSADGLTRRAEPRLEELWAATLSVVERIRGAASLSAGIDAAIDRIVEVLDVDRGMLVLHEPGYDVVVNARAAGAELAPTDREELSRSLVRRARESAQLVYWDAFEGEGANRSAADLGLLAAAAVPLCVGEGTPDDVLGVLYVDLRDQRKTLGPWHERFLVLVACVLASAVRGDRELTRAREELRRARATNARASVPLWSLIAPPGMQELAEDAMAAVRSEAPVLILGESGTGKTALAHAIASASTPNGPVVRATLGMSDDLNTIISELFGHVRGSFSGAGSTRVGLVEHADGGCLVIDEILNMPAHAQQLLLDFTQFGTYRPLGWDGPQPKRARVRLLAATNGDVEAAIADGRLRQDLYYRLAGRVLRVPALRDRREDIPALSEGILRRADSARSWTLSLALRRWIVRAPHAWPGNVRELEAVLSRARQRALDEEPDGEVLDVRHVRPSDLGGQPPSTEPPPAFPSRVPPDIGSLEERWASLEAARETLTSRERAILSETLAEEGGVVSRVARRLGVPRTTLTHRMRVLGVASEKR